MNDATMERFKCLRELYSCNFCILLIASIATEQYYISFA